MKRIIFITLMVLVYLSVGCSAVINPAYPEINVKQRLVDISCDSGEFDIGNVPLNSTQAISFTIENTGTTLMNHQFKRLSNDFTFRRKLSNQTIPIFFHHKLLCRHRSVRNYQTFICYHMLLKPKKAMSPSPSNINDYKF